MIGLEGLGQMGSATQRRLRAEGQGVQGFDLDPALREAARAASAIACASPAGVAAPLVLFSLPQRSPPWRTVCRWFARLRENGGSRA